MYNWSSGWVCFLFGEFLKFIYFKEITRADKLGWGAGGKEGRSKLPAECEAPVQDSISQPWITTWAKIKSILLNLLSHPDAPTNNFKVHVQRKTKNSNMCIDNGGLQVTEVCTILQEIIICFSQILLQRHWDCILKLIMLGVFTSQKLASATNQCSYLPPNSC